MAAVVFAAVVFAGLRATTDFWGRLAFTLCSNMLLIAVIAAVISRDEVRAFWIGFALVGWGNWLTGWCPGIEAKMQDRLLATSFTQYLQPKLQRQVTQTVPATTKGMGGPPGGGMGMGGSPSGRGPGMGVGASQPGTGMGNMALGTQPDGGGGITPVPAGAPATMTVVTQVGPTYNQVWRLLQSSLTILFAMAGGYAAKFLFDRNRSHGKCAP